MLLYHRVKRWQWFCLACAAPLLVAAFAHLTVDYHRHREGVYLLKDGTSGFELTDDVMLGEEERVIAGISWDLVLKRLKVAQAIANGESRLESEWFTSDGSGYVRNIYPDGRQLLVCFSRFKDSDDRATAGLFVGGGLPYHERRDKELVLNDTGMAFFDGKKWRHLWCNANESLALGMGFTQVYPSQWQFLGSRVIVSSGKELVLKSSHLVSAAGTELRVDRYAIFRAGEPYFLLVNKVQNVGSTLGMYLYLYGDEPWVGDYGSSRGNIGWSKDRLYPYEAQLDPAHDSWFGMWDCGNRAAGEAYQPAAPANFIESLGLPPALMYFSNNFGLIAPESAKVPLDSEQNRVLLMQFGPRRILPGRSDLYVFAIGMAGSDGSSVPVKPALAIGMNEVNDLLARDGNLP